MSTTTTAPKPMVTLSQTVTPSFITHELPAKTESPNFTLPFKVAFVEI